MSKLLLTFLLFAVLAGVSHAQTLEANGSFTNQATTILTGESTVFTGNCTVSGGAADIVLVIQDNRTGSFANSTTNTAENVFVNVTNYTESINPSGPSSNFLFRVNATKPGSYRFRSQCFSDTTSPTHANSSDTPDTLTVNQAFGRLNVTLVNPPALTSVVQNRTFVLAANVTCDSANPTAICDEVNGTARYNASSGDAQISNIAGGTPLWADFGNRTCGQLNDSDACSLDWTVNVTGEIGSSHRVGVLFYSNNSGVAQNRTANSTVDTIACSIDFSLQWNLIEFGTLTPSTTGNAAPGNQDNLYNITVNQNSCDLDFYVRGTNLTSEVTSTNITVGNLSWSSTSNDYSSSTRLDYSDVLLKSVVQPLTNTTTWYWIDVPALFANVYNGTVFITGVITGNPP